MADRLTPEQRRLNMSRVRATDTAPEMTIRRMLHAHGFRFRLHRRDLPGRPDIVLARRRTAIFVHGCFWHGHDCPLFRLPATRPEFWSAKIDGNRTRDRIAADRLHQVGWRTLTVWECALKGRGRLPADALATAASTFLYGIAESSEIEGTLTKARPLAKTEQ